MFGSSLPPVVCRRDHVLLTLFTFVGVQRMLCFVFGLFVFVLCLCALCCQFLRMCPVLPVSQDVPCVASFSGFSIFDCPLCFIT